MEECQATPWLFFIKVEGHFVKAVLIEILNENISQLESRDAEQNKTDTNRTVWMLVSTNTHTSC